MEIISPVFATDPEPKDKSFHQKFNAIGSPLVVYRVKNIPVLLKIFHGTGAKILVRLNYQK